MVGAISLRLDSTVGNNDASSAANAPLVVLCGISSGVRFARFGFWHTVCSCAGVAVRIKLEDDHSVDCCRPSMGLRSRNKQFFLWYANYTACSCLAKIKATDVSINDLSHDVIKRGGNFATLLIFLGYIPVHSYSSLITTTAPPTIFP